MRNRILNLALARQIRAAGRPIAIAEDDNPSFHEPSRDVLISQTGGQLETCAFDHGGGTGWILSLSIAIKRSRFAISSFAIETPWEKIGFSWMEDPFERSGSRLYRLGYLEVDRDAVLNHRANSRPLQRGTFMDGFLLGMDFGTIPSRFRRREIDVTLVICDQFDQQHRASLTMLVDRVTKQSKPRTKRAGLFERRDPKPSLPHGMLNPTPDSAKQPVVNEHEIASFLKSLEK